MNVRPYYAEGSKTIGYEIAEDLGWRLPRQIVVPVASGAQLVKIDKAFSEFVSLGLVPEAERHGLRRPGQRLRAGVRGVSPPATTWCSRSGRTRSPSRWRSAIRPTVPTCSTWCAGPAARWPTRRTTEIVDSIRLLAATEGIFGETAVGVTLAVLRRLLAAGQIDPDEETVIINSGDGLKTLNAVSGAVSRARADQAEPGRVHPALRGAESSLRVVVGPPDRTAAPRSAHSARCGNARAVVSLTAPPGKSGVPSPSSRPGHWAGN